MYTLCSVANTPTGDKVASLLRFQDHTHPVGLLWMSDQLVAQAPTYTTHNKHRRPNPMTSSGFERTITAAERLQTYALDLAGIGMGLTYSFSRSNPCPKYCRTWYKRSNHVVDTPDFHSGQFHTISVATDVNIATAWGNAGRTERY